MHDLLNMADMARATGNTADEAKFTTAHAKWKAAWHTAWYDSAKVRRPSSALPSARAESRFSVAPR